MPPTCFCTYISLSLFFMSWSCLLMIFTNLPIFLNLVFPFFFFFFLRKNDLLPKKRKHLPFILLYIMHQLKFSSLYHNRNKNIKIVKQDSILLSSLLLYNNLLILVLSFVSFCFTLLLERHKPFKILHRKLT